MAFEAGNIEVCEIIRSAHDLSYCDPDSFIQSQVTNTQTNVVEDLLEEGRESSSPFLKDVFVHIDLKGAPPKFDYLVRLIEFISERFKYLVTGLVFEFEDMFPFEGHLQQVSSPKAYSKQ